MTKISTNPPQPEQLKLNPKTGAVFSKDTLGNYTDEGLFAALHDCCTPNCLVIHEVIRRFGELKDKTYPSGDEVDGPYDGV